MSETKVFVSYARKDSSLAKQVLRKLRPLPVQVWSEEQLSPGEDWQRTLHKHIKSSDLFLLIVTPNALESSWVLQELGAAWALDKPIVSIVSDKRLLGKLPVQLARTQVITVDQIDRIGDVIQEPISKSAAQD